MPVTPITPKEVAKQKLEQIPGVVISTINKLIAANYVDDEAKVYQDDLMKQLRLIGLSDEEILRGGWLNFEEIYREAGWSVDYDKPAWNEQGRAYFLFTKKQ